MINLHVKKELFGNMGKMLLQVDTKIENGSFVALSGSSGSGKTTLLRIIAGLEESDSIIVVNDEIWQNEKLFLPPQKRKIGFVFQDYALFPNMSIKENLMFVKKDEELAKYLLNSTELYELQDRKPSTLSGGQKQRVSFCRALMNRPKILLMDEPLSALDPLIRSKLQNEILSLHKEFGTTTILVSHEPSEIYKLANRVLVLENGKIKQDGAPSKALLKTSGSQKFSFEGELLDIKKIDVIYVATISIGQQLVEVVISKDEQKNLEIGQKVRVSTKAFLPTVSTF